MDARLPGLFGAKNTPSRGSGDKSCLNSAHKTFFAHTRRSRPYMCEAILVQADTPWTLKAGQIHTQADHV